MPKTHRLQATAVMRHRLMTRRLATAATHHRRTTRLPATAVTPRRLMMVAPKMTVEPHLQATVVTHHRRTTEHRTTMAEHHRQMTEALKTTAECHPQMVPNPHPQTGNSKRVNLPNPHRTVGFKNPRPEALSLPLAVSSSLLRTVRNPHQASSSLSRPLVSSSMSRRPVSSHLNHLPETSYLKNSSQMVETSIPEISQREISNQTVETPLVRHLNPGLKVRSLLTHAETSSLMVLRPLAASRFSKARLALTLPDRHSADLSSSRMGSSMISSILEISHQTCS